MTVLGKLFWLVCLISSLGTPLLASAQEGIFLKEEEAPKAVFPEAASFERRVIRSSEVLKTKIQQRLGRTKTSIWEDSYVTFIVGVGVDRKIKDAALMVYREAYGGEVRDRRFLQQYRGKQLSDPLLPFRDIQNISGATMSVEAIGRGSKKALALVEAIYLEATEPK